MKKECTAEDCEREIRARGFCKKHYDRLHRTGKLKSDYKRDSQDSLRELRRFLKVRSHKNGDCWEWIGARNNYGYGMLIFRGRKYVTSRLSAFVWKGFDLESKLNVCHTCDNPPCINPDHLFVATQKENILDASEKGRLFGRNVGRGERHGSSKLKERQVLDARERRRGGESFNSIARSMMVDPSNIEMICKYKTWKHLP